MTTEQLLKSFKCSFTLALGSRSCLNPQVFSCLTLEALPGSLKLGAWDHHVPLEPASVSKGICSYPVATWAGVGPRIPAGDTRSNLPAELFSQSQRTPAFPNFSSEIHSIAQKTCIRWKGVRFTIRAGMMNPTLRFLGTEIKFSNTDTDKTLMWSAQDVLYSLS